MDFGRRDLIRKLRLRQGLTIREIARSIGLSRNTIKTYLKAEVGEPHCAAPERPSKLDPFAETLAGWLNSNAGKPRKVRQTLTKRHADLVALGLGGSCHRVAAFAREWQADRQRERQTMGRGTFVPLAFHAGDAFQVDGSEDFAGGGGERTKLQVAHITLSHSRAVLLRAYGSRYGASCTYRFSDRRIRREGLAPGPARKDVRVLAATMR